MTIKRIGRTAIEILTALLLLLISFSCSNLKGGKLKRHDLFSIPLGVMPGELDWFYRKGFQMAGTAEIQSRDGLIYISGAEAGKVMVFNSYGDLVTYVYDPHRNPVPVSIDDDEDNRAFVPWSFFNPRSIAVFSEGFLVEDSVEEERRLLIEETGIYYDRIILRFSQDGSYIGHLGREGFGGSPFPYISSLDVREDESIVVTSRIPGKWMSYWFDKNGRPLSTIEIREDKLPGLESGSSVAVYSIRPDPLNWNLYIRLDVYSGDLREKGPEARLYSLDLTTLKYSEPIIIPYIGGDEKSGIPSIPPNYLGTTVMGTHVLTAPEGSNNYRLVIMDEEGRFIQNRRLVIDSSDIIYRKFRLQNDGMITGIFYDNSEATVTWWRADKLETVD